MSSTSVSTSNSAQLPAAAREAVSSVFACPLPLPLALTTSAQQESRLSIFGKARGIQGKSNSCYADTSLMMLFAFQNHFDRLLTVEPKLTTSGASSNADSARRSHKHRHSSGDGDADANSTSSDFDGNEMRFFRQFLASMIVRPLRSRCFVPYAHIMTLRNLMSSLLRLNTTEDFVNAGETEDVTVFIQRLAHILAGSSPIIVSSSSAPSLTSEQSAWVNDLLDVKVVTRTRSNGKTTSVTTQQILQDNEIALDCCTAMQPLLLNVPRGDDGALPYGSIVPSLFIDLSPSSPPANAGPAGEVGQQGGGVADSSACLELVGIITFDPSIRHYCALLKVDNNSNNVDTNSRDRTTWVEFDSMSDVTPSQNEFLPSIQPVEMSVFEDLHRWPPLMTMCCEILFPSPEFRDFLQSEAHGDSPWKTFKKATTRPYLYLYVPCRGEEALRKRPKVENDALQNIECDVSLAERLWKQLLQHHHWSLAISAWFRKDVEERRPKPPPLIHGCPDCGAVFDSEEAFLQHMRRMVCQPRLRSTTSPSQQPPPLIPVTSQDYRVASPTYSPGSPSGSSKSTSGVYAATAPPPPVAALSPVVTPNYTSTSYSGGEHPQRRHPPASTAGVVAAAPSASPGTVQCSLCSRNISALDWRWHRLTCTQPSSTYNPSSYSSGGYNGAGSSPYGNLYTRRY